MSKNFVDRARIYVKAGNGGNGHSSFLREKYVAMGGPDGGDGGNGGSIIFRADENLNTLLDFKHRSHFKAGNGGHGGRKNCHGANADHVYIGVPVGTIVYDDSGERCLADLAYHGAEYVVAKGGRGGRGNVHFITADRKAPREYELGEPGDELWVRLELRVVAQVGIIGFPNVGKSTLLATVTDAQPAIANYPFTTLSPVLGVVERNYSRLILADIPGLIEGAAGGAGLGHDFLRHIARTRVLLHILDLTAVDADNPMANYAVIRRELVDYDPDLQYRPEVVAVNKIDEEGHEEALRALDMAMRKTGKRLHKISCLTGEGVEDLLAEVFEVVREAPSLPKMVIETAEPPAVDDFEVFDEDGIWVVRGVRVEKAVAMTDLDEEESLNRLQRRFNAWGVEDALTQAGAMPGDTVRIGKSEFAFEPKPAWLAEYEAEKSKAPDVRPSQAVRLEEKKQRRNERQSLAAMAGLRGRGKRKR
ncbi:MAG: GTPase ObgE [bacterium]|nr:GTPase ObgE [bacterium]